MKQNCGIVTASKQHGETLCYTLMPFKFLE